MFQFSRFASMSYVLAHGYSPDGEWVTPFGNARVAGYLPPHRALSQAVTSFIASGCLGIHRARFIA